jgi:hypothetical protein
MSFKDLPEYLQNVIESSSKCHVDNLGIYRYNHQIAEAIQSYAEEYAAEENEKLKEDADRLFQDVEDWARMYQKLESSTFKNPWRPIDEHLDFSRGYSIFYFSESGNIRKAFWDDTHWVDEFDNEECSPTHYYDERILPLPKAGE